jgi:HEAT repeat protein
MRQSKTEVHPILARIIKEINVAVRRLGMYPPDHPARLETVERPFSILQEAFRKTKQVTISKMGNEVVVNGINVGTNVLPRRLEREFKSQNINSLTFTDIMAKEEFVKFLNFFTRPLGERGPSENLSEFLKINRIDSIKINQLRYELVSEDEAVVKTEVLEGADLKVQISKIIKENPDLIKDILLNKPVQQETFTEKFGSGMTVDQLTQEINQQVKNLTDDEVLSLLASGLEFTLKKHEGEDKESVVNEVANLVNKLLEERERKKLLPEVKKILSGYRILEEKYFDLIFEEKWLKSQAVLDEVVGLMDKLGKEELDFERFVFVVHRAIDSEEEKIRLYVIDKLLANLNSKNSETRRLSVLALKEILSRLISGKMEVEFVYLRDRLYEKIKDQPLSAYILKDSTELVKIIFSEMMQRQEFEEAKKIISEYNAKMSKEVSYPQEVRVIAKGFLREISGESTISLLTNQLREDRAVQNTRVIEEILESLDKDKVAEKLIEIFTVDDRATRISSLRILSKLGQSSVVALAGLLSHINVFSREEGTQFLTDEHWYKVRNAIYVLGNIPDVSSVEVLSKLNSDPDPRVRLEVIKALEKIGKEESVEVLLTFLKDRDDQVRKSAITSLSTHGNKRCLKSLIDHFRCNRKDKILTLTAIGKIGGAEATEFLLKILSKEDSGVRHLSIRQREEIIITALDVLGKISSASSARVETADLASEIEKLIKERKKGIKGFFLKDPVAETAERVLKMMKN